MKQASHARWSPVAHQALDALDLRSSVRSESLPLKWRAMKSLIQTILASSLQCRHLRDMLQHHRLRRKFNILVPNSFLIWCKLTAVVAPENWRLVISATPAEIGFLPISNAAWADPYTWRRHWPSEISWWSDETSSCSWCSDGMNHNCLDLKTE